MSSDPLDFEGFRDETTFKISHTDVDLKTKMCDDYDLANIYEMSSD